MQRSLMRRRPSTTPLTMADLGRLAGASASTVSRALAESPLVAPKKREQIVRLARERGYVVNAQARNLRLRRKQRTISVVVLMGQELRIQPSDLVIGQMIGCLVDEMTRNDYGMYLRKVTAPTAHWLDEMVDSGDSDAILILGQQDEHEALQRVAKRYRPLVVWGAHHPRQSYCSVGTDNESGAKAAVEHLVNIGRRRIAFVGSVAFPPMRLRYEGYRQSVARLPSPAAQTISCGLDASSACAVVSAAVRDGASFDAIFAGNDVIAIGAMRALLAAGIAVPEQVAVVGFGDIPVAAYCNPPLTTVRQDLPRAAKTLIDVLLRRVSGEQTRSVTLPVELVVRESSAPRAENLAAGTR
jgi:DNA-binding LacI/PurR family transcriptional regulator